MKTEQFLRHHGIVGNPFSEEDAQTDTVFKRGCLGTIHHPAWDKFFGSPADPSTALVFGEKGSGKTALRLQATAELEAYNQAHPHERVFVISYDDFNPYLDHFRTAVRASDTAQALSRWRLQDHMDAILALGVTQAGRHADHREGRPLGPEPRPAPRPAAAGGALRPVDGRADRTPLGPAPPPLGLPAALEPPRPADRLRHDAVRHRPHRADPLVPALEHPALAAAADRAGLALLGLAAGPRRVVREAHPQGPARAQPRPVRPALGAALVQAERAGGPAAADRRADRRRGALRAAPQVPGGPAHARLRRDRRPDRPGGRAAADRGRPAQDARR